MQGRISGPLPANLTVIETMRVERDGRIALWSLHRDRLRRDCAAVGFPLDERGVENALREVPQGHVMRARLTIDRSGVIGLTHQPLAPNPSVWHVMVATQRLDRRDPWLQIKTSRRPVYDTVRANLPPGVDEAILLNQQDDVCEGTITSLFLRRHDRLLTPPLECGLLPGVLRQSLIESGQAVEHCLRLRELHDGELFLGNALRGLIPARLTGIQ